MAIPAAVFVYILSQNDLFWDKLCLMGRLISCSTLFWIYLPTLGGKILSQTESPAAVFNSTNISVLKFEKKAAIFNQSQSSYTKLRDHATSHSLPNRPMVKHAQTGNVTTKTTRGRFRRERSQNHPCDVNKMMTRSQKKKYLKSVNCIFANNLSKQPKM